MQPSDVTAYGCDYSAREFAPQELGHYPGVKIEWLARYIGYPSNVKCISHYPGAYRAHRDAGRPVALYHQIGYRDFEGGAASGRAQAQVALADARSVGWDGETPIIACFDRRMPAFARGGVTYRAIWLDEVRDYVRGFTSVLGYDDAGFYGFEDTMKPCCDEDWVRFRMQCGARSAHVRGISAWQENNEQPLLLGTQTDRLELYISLAELGGDVALDAERDYPALLTMLQRAFTFDLRPKGAGADWQLGPTIYETLGMLLSKSVADVDEDALAEALAKRGFDGASPAEVKAAVAEVLAGTRLTPTTPDAPTE